METRKDTHLFVDQGKFNLEEVERLAKVLADAKRDYDEAEKRLQADQQEFAGKPWLTHSAPDDGRKFSAADPRPAKEDAPLKVFKKREYPKAPGE